MRAAIAALEWSEDSARAVHAALPGLVAHALRELAEREPSTRGQEERLRDELTLQLSYLMDALGVKRPGLFAEHARWYAGFWPQRGLPCDYRTLLETLEAALAHAPSVAELPRVTVANGLTALAKEQS
jgi:hypothetical protein